MNFLLSTLSSDFAEITNRSKSIFSAFSFKDALEILILTVVFFFIYKFLKGRKVGTIFMGIAICVLFLAVSRAFNLDVIYAVFKTIVGSGPIVLVIIFQPEIREALEKLGSGSISGIVSFSERKNKKELYFKVIDEISDAVNEMAKSYTGAIIVIERTTKLGDIIASGVEVNADVKSLLLRNLFFNKAPLHDGAVVITDGKITAAGCFLPLTRRLDVDSDLGTRHRAAIGMSESSDAIIIVVSEETGKISVAYDCQLKRDFTKDTLKEFLLENLLKVSFNQNKKA